MPYAFERANETFVALRDSPGKIITKPMLDEMIDSLPKRIQAFVPRPLNNCNNVSPHSVGKAIDVDPGKNPHLTGARRIAIDKLLEATGATSKRLHQRFFPKQRSKNKSQLALRGFQVGQLNRLDAKTIGRKKLAILWLRNAFPGNTLDALEANGIFSLSAIFVLIMKMARSVSGTEFKNAKDPMHFEVEAWDQRP